MTERDIPQAAEVEKDAFPELFPATSFRREMRSDRARYLSLARDGASQTADMRLPPLPSAPQSAARDDLLGRLASGARRMWRRRNPSWRPGEDLIVGFVGLWRMVDEAHIVSIGVRGEYRGLGLGELLLIAAFEQATAMGVGAVSLEVRVSNHVAQNLYKKYGMTVRGKRKGYYTDNREDALIMTSERIDDERGRRALQVLAAAHERRWGASDRRVSER